MPHAGRYRGLSHRRSRSPNRRWQPARHRDPDLAAQNGFKPEDYDHGHDVNRHGDNIRAFCLTYDRPLNWDRLNAWIEMLITLYGGGLLRIKGILNVEQFDLPLVVHGVQHLFHPPVQLEAWPDDDRRSRLVFITRDLDPELFEHTLKAFNEDEAAPPAA